jgi:hypothetical protein
VDQSASNYYRSKRIGLATNDRIDVASGLVQPVPSVLISVIAETKLGANFVLID